MNEEQTIQPGAEEQSLKGIAALRKRYQDADAETNWDEMDDNAVVDRSMSDYDALKGEHEGLKKFTDGLKGAMDKDKRGAAFLVGLADGVDFIENLYGSYGDLIFEAANNPEKRKELAAKMAERDELIAQDEQIRKQREENLDKTEATLEQFKSEHGLSDDEMEELLNQLDNIHMQFHVGLITPEFLNALYKGNNHDNDVALAREDGRIDGANQRIEKEKLRKPKGDGIPFVGGAQNSATGGAKTIQRQAENRGGSIWDRGGEEKRSGRRLVR